MSVEERVVVNINEHINVNIDKRTPFKLYQLSLSTTHKAVIIERA